MFALSLIVMVTQEDKIRRVYLPDSVYDTIRKLHLVVSSHWSTVNRQRHLVKQLLALLRIQNVLV